MSKVRYIIARHAAAKRRRQWLEAEIAHLTEQAAREQRITGAPLPATLKKLHNRKLKLQNL